MNIHLRQQLGVVAGVPDDLLQIVEVDRRHLRNENCICILHFLREQFPFVIFLTLLRMDAVSVPLFHRRFQGTDTDFRRSQVGNLIDFQHCVQLVVPAQNLFHLVGGHGVQAASERIQLNQLHIIPPAHELSRLVQPGMVDPLVQNPERSFQFHLLSHRILGQHDEIKGTDHLVHAVVDFRVHMIRPSGEDDRLLVMLLCILQRILSLLPHIIMILLHFPSAGSHCTPDLLLRNMIRRKCSGQFPHQSLIVVKRQERMKETDIVFCENIVQIVGDYFRIRCHNRAVEMIRRTRIFVPFEIQARIEDELISVVHQPLHMAVYQFRRIACRIRRNCFDAQLVDFLRGSRGQLHPEFQIRKEPEPERVVLVHVQNPWNSHSSPLRLHFIQRMIPKQTLELILVQVRQLVLLRCVPGTFLAAVSRDETLSVAEHIDGQQALILTAVASSVIVLHLEMIQLFPAQDGRLRSFHIVFLCDNGTAVGTHQSGDVRPDHVLSDNLFEAAEHRIIQESSSLYNDMISGLVRIPHFDYLVQRIPDDGIGQPCGNIRNGGAFLLGLLHLGIHKHRTAGSQIHRALRVQRFLGERPGIQIHGLGVSFQERAAARRAGFIQHDAVDRPVLDLHAFHVLSADVQNEIHVRTEVSGRLIVGHGLNLSHVRPEAGLDQPFAVSCDTGIGNIRPLRQLLVQVDQNLTHHFRRIALIAAILFKQQTPVAVHQRRLRCGGTGVNPQEGHPSRFPDILPLHLILIVTSHKPLILLFRPEQRFHVLRVRKQGLIRMGDAVQNLR